MGEGTLPIAVAPSRSSSGDVLAREIGLHWVVCAWAAFVLSLVFFSFAVANWNSIFFSAATTILFVLPGILVMPALLGSDRHSFLLRTIVGSVFGTAISSYVAVVTGIVVGWSPKAIGMAIGGLCCICFAIARFFRGNIPLLAREWTRTDSLILGVMSTVVVVFSTLPAMHVGKLTSRGYAYTWLYGIDFLARNDFTVAMTRKIPPDLFWMTGVPLRMYLIGYAAPAFAYSSSRESVNLHSMTLLLTLVFALLLVACLYLFLRTIFSQTRVLAGAAFVALFAYSYYWPYDVLKAFTMKPGQRMQFYDSVSHLFQRSILVEPQALLATSLLLIVVSVLLLVRFRLTSFGLAAFLGICLGVSFGSDAMQGAVMIGWFGIFCVCRFVFVKDALKSEWTQFLTVVATTGIICGSYFLLGMYARSSSHLVVVEFNTWIVKYGLAFFPAEFGPLVVLGVWGAILWWRSSRHAEEFGWPLLVMAAIAMLPVLFLKQTTVPRTRMADRLLPIVLIAFTGFLIRELWSREGSRKARVAVIALVFLGIPTFFTDIYYASNVEDLYNTRYVRVEDMKACEWIRQNLPESAVIQGSYNYVTGPDRGVYISLISSFAQRPQVLGWFSGAATLVDDGWTLAEKRREDIESSLSSGDLTSVVWFVQKYSVDYIYVSSVEDRKFKRLRPLLQSSPDQFQEVYSQDGVAIFRYLGKGKIPLLPASGS